MHVSRIKKQKENVERMGPILPKRKRKIPADVIEFEKRFYQQFNRQLTKYGPQCFEQAQIKCLQIQKEARFKDCPDVQKMKFSRGWRQAFQSDRGMRW